jgi:hypothetical protein
MTSYEFSTKRFYRSLKIIALVASVCISLTITIVLAGGASLFDPQFVEPFLFANDEIDNGKQTWFLFPGTSDSIAGLLYMLFVSFVGLFATGLIGCLLFRLAAYTLNPDYVDDLVPFEQCILDYPFLFISAIPLVPLILHLCGNIHWQFYCVINVIDEQNCFWIFDARSLFISIAGVVEVCLCLLVLVLSLLFCRPVCQCLA